MTQEQIDHDQAEQALTLYTIASTKGYNYCQEYNSRSGQVENKEGHLYLKLGYVDGFLAGFAHRLTGDN